MKDRDRKTLGKITALADYVAKSAHGLKGGGREIAIDIPTRSRSNTVWDKRKRILQMGDGVQTRELFNLNQAKQFMQTMLHASTIKDLIDADKTSSLRGVFYKAKHTVAGTKENTFDDQGESDPILEDLEVGLDALREELHVFAEPRGGMVGNITIVDKGDEIDCRRMGSGGYQMPFPEPRRTRSRPTWRVVEDLHSARRSSRCTKAHGDWERATVVREIKPSAANLPGWS
jgi:DNA topoisomerase-6 subunit A